MSVGEWIVTMIVLAIPCVGLIMMFVWGFGEGNASRRNYCRAALIMTAIGIVLSIILYATVFAALMSSMGSLS